MTATNPALQDTTSRLAAALARITEEADFARLRAGWIERVGGHPEWWQSRAVRYSAAATRLRAARARVAA